MEIYSEETIEKVVYDIFQFYLTFSYHFFLICWLSTNFQFENLWKQVQEQKDREIGLNKGRKDRGFTRSTPWYYDEQLFFEVLSNQMPVLTIAKILLFHGFILSSEKLREEFLEKLFPLYKSREDTAASGYLKSNSMKMQFKGLADIVNAKIFLNK